jgi:GT2 family glycosyltransferase
LARERPRVDVVVPFAGSDRDLGAAVARLAALELRSGDSIALVDNRSSAPGVRRIGPVTVLGAPERRSSYFARNRGAGAGDAEWIVFLDADVIPPPDLLDRFFDPTPRARTAVLAGGLVDSAPRAGERAGMAVRWGVHRSTMSQVNTLGGRWGFAQTASCAVRRTAFEGVGGFRDDIRSAGDADLCYRLRGGGWEIESREAAESVHISRPTLRKLARQRLRHGSGSAWLDREYPGSAPGHGNWPGLLKWTLQSAGRTGVDALLGRREIATIAFVDLLVLWAAELGRLLPNRVR